MRSMSIEQQACQNYLRQTEIHCEQPFESWISRGCRGGLIVAEGFEERSVGVLERLADANITLPGVVIGRYVKGDENNHRFWERCKKAVERVASGKWCTVENHNDGLWVRQALELLPSDEVVLDITGISNRALFTALDVAAASGRTVDIVYSEARQYWPKKADWIDFKHGLTGSSTLAEMMDEKPWLFGPQHHVELVPDHEGNDTAGTGCALVAFLPFKCARLGAVLGLGDYSKTLYIAGRPRLKKNAWRLDALMEINAPILGQSTIVKMPTFGYRAAFKCLTTLLFSTDALLKRYNVHMAILGSKLQTVGCWALSHVISSITVITSVPQKYYAEAFSEGVGRSWVFKLTKP